MAFSFLTPFLVESSYDSHRLEEIDCNNEHKTNADFHGVCSSVNLFQCTRNLLNRIQNVWPAFLNLLITNQSLRSAVICEYVAFLRSGAVAAPSELIRIIWVCHMADAFCYYADCMRLCGTLIDHSLPPLDIDGNELHVNVKYQRSTYSLPPLSMDIQKAIYWLNDICYSLAFPHYADEKFLKTSIERYFKFLFFVRSYPHTFPILPRPSDIMLVWMAHVINPLSFRNDLKIMLGDSACILISRMKFYSTFSDPSALWLDMFKESLVIPGTIHRARLPHHVLGTFEPFNMIKNIPLKLHIDDNTNLLVDCFLSTKVDQKYRISTGDIIQIKHPSRSFNVYTRHGSWPLVKWNRVLNATLPLSGPSTFNISGVGALAVSLLNTNIVMHAEGRNIGIRRLPANVTALSEVPFGSSSEVYVYNFLECEFAVHFIPQFSILILFDSTIPIVACKLMSPFLLPAINQLKNPLASPCLKNGEACMIVHSCNGDQALVIFGRESEVRICALHPSFSSVKTLPACRLYQEGCYEITFPLSLVSSPCFSCLLSATLALRIFCDFDSPILQTLDYESDPEHSDDLMTYEF